LVLAGCPASTSAGPAGDRNGGTRFLGTAPQARSGGENRGEKAPKKPAKPPRRKAPHKSHHPPPPRPPQPQPPQPLTAQPRQPRQPPQPQPLPQPPHARANLSPSRGVPASSLSNT